MKTVLVTGATGALGKVIIERLRQVSHINVVAPNRNSGDVNDCKLDVCNSEQLVAVIEKVAPSLVLHLAATFTTDFDEAYAVNVESARQILETVHHSGIKTRVLLVGSAAEYGIVQPEDNPICESRLLKPVSVYGLTKAWQSQLACVYNNRGVDVVVARVFNLYGPGLSDSLFIGRLEKQINEVLMGTKSLIELGSLEATRDYISTDEAANQILAIAEHGESGEVYHVASGLPMTMRQILNNYLAIHNLDASSVNESPDLTNRIGYDVPVIFADVTKTIQLMNL